MNTHSWGSCLQTLQFRFGKLYQFVCIWIQMCVFVCDCALRLNSLVCSERYKKATEIEHVLSSQFGAVVVVVFLSSNSHWECVILALQKQKQTKNRKKKSSKTRQCVHLNCQIELPLPLFYVNTLNFISLLKIQIRFYFKELVAVHCVWNGIHIFRMATAFNCICVLLWFCFPLCIKIFACEIISYI